jgi:hypothetical protein
MGADDACSTFSLYLYGSLISSLIIVFVLFMSVDLVSQETQLGLVTATSIACIFIMPLITKYRVDAIKHKCCLDGSLKDSIIVIPKKESNVSMPPPPTRQDASRDILASLGTGEMKSF